MKKKHLKDKPRYIVVSELERETKKSYAKYLGESLTAVNTKLMKLVTK